MGFGCIKQNSQTTLRVLAALPLIFLLVNFLWYGGHKQLIKSLIKIKSNIPLKISVRFYFMLKEKSQDILHKSVTPIWIWNRKNPTPQDEPNYDLRGLYVNLNSFSGIISSLYGSHIDQNIILGLTFSSTKSSKKKKKSIYFDPPTHEHELYYYFTSPTQFCILFCKDIGEDGLDNLFQHQMAGACKTKWDKCTSF